MILSKDMLKHMNVRKLNISTAQNRKSKNNETSVKYLDCIHRFNLNQSRSRVMYMVLKMVASGSLHHIIITLLLSSLTIFSV